uniref:ULP_PROTEASE domain-containing protein n=1 Tax=Macrostomum lignano TaxID=282301 RepID=A0A1I8H705_9PLAT
SAEDREQARITALEVARQEERNRAAERIREPVSTLSQVITSLCGRVTNTGDQPNAQPAAASAALLDGDVGAPLLDAADGGGTPDFELNVLDTAFFENLDGEPEAQEQQEMQQQQQRRAIPVPGKNMERARMLAEVSLSDMIRDMDSALRLHHRHHRLRFSLRSNLSDVIRDMDSGPAPPPPPPPTEVQPAVEVSLSDVIRDMDSGPAPPPPPPPTEVQPAVEVSLSDVIRDMDSGPAPPPPPPPTEVQPAVEVSLSDVIRDMDSGPAPPPPPPPTEVQPAVEVSLSDVIRDMDSGPAPPPPPPPTEVQPAVEVSLSDVIRDMDSGPAPPPPPPPTEVQPAVEVSLSDVIRDMDSGPAPPPPPPPTEVQPAVDSLSDPAAANEVQQPAPLCIQLVLPNSVTGIQFSSAIHASAHDDTLQVRRFTPASRGLEPFHFLSSTKFAVLQAVEMRFDSSENKSIRAQLKFNIRMVRIKEAAVINAEDKWIACGLELLSDLRDFELWWLQQFSELERKIDAYNSNGSGWIVEQINYFDLCSALTDRIRYYRGRCANFSLPNQLAVKKAIINPPSDGNNCFLFACLAYLHNRDPGVMKSCHRLTTYSRWLDEIDLSGIALPVAISDLDVIEEKNSEICFTVFSWEDDEAYEELEQHRDSCNPQLKPAIMERMPDASSNTMQFMAWEKTISPPFVVYADFEALNTPREPVESEREVTVTKLTEHVPVAAGYIVIPREGMSSKILRPSEDVFLCSGPNPNSVVKQFLASLERLAREVYGWNTEFSHQIADRNSDDNRRSFQDATQCYLCNAVFISSSDKHWDHDHLSGEYKGAACASCNKLARLKRRFLPIVFHNLRGYDLHLIFSTALGDMTGWRVSVIPQTAESYLSMRVEFQIDEYEKDGVKKPLFFTLQFIDSLQFLHSSLSQLIKNLPEDNCPITNAMRSNQEELCSWSECRFLSLDDDAPIGYLVEADLLYPAEIHTATEDLPFAPEKRCPNFEEFPQYMRELWVLLQHDNDHSQHHQQQQPDANTTENPTVARYRGREVLPILHAEGLLDTSNFFTNHPLFSNRLKAKLGCIKDEAGGLQQIEWVLLRPKLYSFLAESSAACKAKAKGIQRSVLKNEVSHDDYVKIFKGASKLSLTVRRIGSEKHRVFTIEQRKLALSIWEDKRAWTGSNSSLPFGHFQLLIRGSPKRTADCLE